MGSSRSSRSGSATSSAASATRRRSPPDIGPTMASQPPIPAASMPPSSPSSTSRIRGSAAQSCSGRSPSTASRTVATGSRSSACASIPMVRPPVRAIRPVSIGRVPASTRSSVDLPPPLRPTTPMRSPSRTPSETSSSRWVGAERQVRAFDGDQVGHGTFASRSSCGGVGLWTNDHTGARRASGVTAASVATAASRIAPARSRSTHPRVTAGPGESSRRAPRAPVRSRA